MKIVEIENLVKRYGDLVALDHLNLNLSRKGKSSDFWDRTEAGKTTAINCMLSLLKYDKGRDPVIRTKNGTGSL